MNKYTWELEEFGTCYALAETEERARDILLKEFWVHNQTVQEVWVIDVKYNYYLRTRYARFNRLLSTPSTCCDSESRVSIEHPKGEL